jgi:hypothetical protein
MAEVRRVAGSLVASSFLAGWTHPAKTRVDQTAGSFGFVSPDWYRGIKSGPEAAVEDPARLATAASEAGYRNIAVTVHDVDVGLRTARQIVAWRLGMAHLAPFVATLDPARRRELRQACIDVLDGVAPVRVPMVVLAATS